jgi:uncharacterized phage protein gp47/JayE
MPFARPTLTQLRSQVLSDIATSDLPNADSLLRRAVLRVLGTVFAGLIYMLYGYLDWIALQCTPYTATDEYADAWGGLVGVTRKAATAATGTATFTGTAGTTIPSGTALQRNDGTAFTTTAAGTVAAGATTVTVPILCSVPGSAGDTDAGTQVALAAAVPGIVSIGSMQAASGFDVEDNGSYRDRYLAQYRAPPHGGDAADYVQWATAQPGITRAWTVPCGLGPGTVQVFFMEDGNAFAGFPQGTNGVATAELRDDPATGDQLALANALFPLQPVPALVYACAPLPAPLAFTINDATLPTGGAALVTAALADVFLRKATPLGTYILPSEFESAIASVPGVGDFTLASPTLPVNAPPGSILTVGTITYGATTLPGV